MLKRRNIQLHGRDGGLTICLTERPALVADRAARTLIASWGAEPSGGVVALTLRHQPELARLGEAAISALAPFVDAYHLDGRPFEWNDLQDWRNIARIQQAALLLHVDFLIGREMPDMPVEMRAEAILKGGTSDGVTFCSPFIAGVLQSDLRLYVELETTLSTEDAFNMAELLNLDAIREWRASRSSKGPK